MLPVPANRAMQSSPHWSPPIDQAGNYMPQFEQRRPGSGLLTQLWRRRLVFLGVFALVCALVAVAIALLPTRYISTGSVIIGDEAPLGGDASAAWVQKLGDPADLESQLLLIHSARLLHTVLDQPDVQQAITEECDASQKHSMLSAVRTPFDCRRLTTESEEALRWVDQRYSAGSVGRSRVISIAYESASPKTATLMANALVAAYLKADLDEKVESRKSTVAWLRKEIGQLNEGLKSEDLQLQQYRRDHGLIRGQFAPISSEEMTATAQQLALAQASQAQAAARLKESTGRSANTRAVLDSHTVEILKQQLSMVTAQLANASQSFGTSHPAYIALQRQRDDIQARLSAETQDIVSSAQKSYTATSAQVAALSKELDRLKQRAGTADSSEAAIASMVRDGDIKRQLYVELYKKASELETQQRVLTGNARLVSYAEEPMQPSFPKRLPFAAGGVVLATILGTAAAFLRDMSDKTVRESEMLETLAGVPVLAQIPVARAERRGLRGEPGDVLQPCALQEAIRKLYATLMLAHARQRLKTLLVTSTDAEEGKTFTALALAQFAAASGRRVLVIECDLRRPKFAASLPLQQQPGLVEYLSGSANAADILQASGINGLHVIPAGSSHIGSTELLFGSRFGDLLRATDAYDLVIIDSPPSEILMDARIIARNVDAVLYCASWGKVDESAVADGIANVQRSGGEVIGVAVTMVREQSYSYYNRRSMPKHPYLLQGA